MHGLAYGAYITLQRLWQMNAGLLLVFGSGLLAVLRLPVHTCMVYIRALAQANADGGERRWWRTQMVANADGTGRYKSVGTRNKLFHFTS